MRELLPPDSSFSLRQQPGRWLRKQLLTHDHLVIVTPSTIPESLWRQLPAELQGLSRTVRRLGKAGQRQLLAAHLPPGTRVTLARLPAVPADGSGTCMHALLRFGGQVAAEALSEKPKQLALLLLGVPEAEQPRVAGSLLLGLHAHHLPLPQFRSKPRLSPLARVTLLGAERELDLERVMIEAEALHLVRWLTSLPANHLDAGNYRELARTLAKRHGWSFRFHDQGELRRLGAGAFLAVAQGNGPGSEAGIVRLRYRPDGRRSKPDIALVGKGIIFDTGGVNLKPFRAMLDMHQDMSGSAVALGLLLALTRLKSRLAVDCYLAITENRIGPAAVKPRDVIRALDGTTIEMIHTDAEGRLVLADTLALAGREKPSMICDFATLTGSCVHAVSERYSGVFSNRPALHGPLVMAGQASGERLWPFPLDPDFDDDLDSSVADVLQCAVDAPADHILAARFLQRFVPADTTWVHMDLSSASRRQGLGQVPGGATGFGIRCMLALLVDQREAVGQALGH